MEVESNESKSAISYSVIMSYFQIYNEQIKDLLLREAGQQIEVLEDPIRGTVIVGLAQVTVTKGSEVLDLIELGTNNRVTGETEANATSSRSHAVL